LDLSEFSDRRLAVYALWQAQQLDADAGPWPSSEALFLVLGVARLLAADPLILCPCTGGEWAILRIAPRQVPIPTSHARARHPQSYPGE
jgi:hypothetical protein